MKYVYSILHITIYSIFFILLWFIINLIFPLVVAIVNLVLGFDLGGGIDPVGNAVRSTPGSLREYFLLQLAPVAIASYLAVKMLNILKIRYNGKAILYGFGILASGFSIYGLSVMIPVARLTGFTFFDYLIQIATPVTAITVLYFTIRRENEDRELREILKEVNERKN